MHKAVIVAADAAIINGICGLESYNIIAIDRETIRTKIGIRACQTFGLLGGSCLTRFLFFFFH